MPRVQAAFGMTGYRHQLDRARRFLDRVESADQSEVEFHDMILSLFQHCWHIKDWVKYDSHISDPQKKQAVQDKTHASALLMICRDLCNGTKHLKLSDPSCGQDGASPRYVNTTITPGSGTPSKLDCIVDDGHGNLISGKQLARDCMAEWERILQSEGLAFSRLS